MSDHPGDTTGGSPGDGPPVRPPVDLGIDGYDRYEEIGRGGFSVVYKANQQAFDRTVAIKVISGTADEQTLMRFERECRTMGSMSDHPSIVTVFGNGRTDKGDLYIVMEYLAKGSLADRLAQGPLSWDEVVDVGIRIAEALQAAHDSGVLHRDVKPENIFVSKHGEAKLGDFGIARLEGGASTRSGVITASVAHAAPEILDGKKPNEASDVYSLGSTLYTLLAGSPAFSSATDESIVPMLARIAIEPVPDLRPVGVPDQVCAVLEASMAKKLDDRITTAGAFAQRLREARDAVLRGEPGTTQPVVPILPAGGASTGSGDQWGYAAAPVVTDPNAAAAAWTPNPAVPYDTGQTDTTGQYASGTGQYAAPVTPGAYDPGQQHTGPQHTGEYAPGQYDTGQHQTGQYTGYSTGPVPGTVGGGGAKVALVVVLVLVVLGVIGAIGVALTGSSSTTTVLAVSSTTSTSTSTSTTTSEAPGLTTMKDLGLRDCFDHPDLQGVIDGSAESDVAITQADCDGPHDMQIVGQEIVRASRNEAYPSDLSDRASVLCLEGFEGFVGATFDDLADVYGAISVFPDEQQWADGERNVVCAAYQLDGTKLEGTLEGTG